MAYMIIHVSGKNESNYPLDDLSIILSELEGSSDEEAYVALTHESEWCLSVNPFGLLMWENNFSELEDSWHMENITEEKVLKLWRLLAKGEIEKIQRKPWIKGDPIYGI
jgi:hypothetical protein